MRFAQALLNRTPQLKRVFRTKQVQNSAGGYTWRADSWTLLDRFLILGTEGGTYYSGEHKLSLENAENLISLIHSDGLRVVERIIEISKSGRAPKKGPAIFALAVASSIGDEATRRAALSAVPTVCRTGSDLFAFVAEIDELRGWGRGLRAAVQSWYNKRSTHELAYQTMKYQQRGGWSHRDVLRLAHPKSSTTEQDELYKWIVSGTYSGDNERVLAAIELKASTSVARAVELIQAFNLPREVVPSELLKSPEVWAALFTDMPMTAMLRNLGTMSRVGLLTVGSGAAQAVCDRLQSEALLHAAKVHPLAVLIARSTYVSGSGFRSSQSWTPVPAVVDALDQAFRLSFGSAPSTGKRHLVAVDVSGSMAGWNLSGTNLSASEAATAMALVTMAREDNCWTMGFADDFRKLPLTAKMSLSEAMMHTQNASFGATDCALPMLEAKRRKWEVDVFVVYTDNETWFGNVHPFQALRQYRQATGIPAKLAVVGMCSNRFTIANPNDPGMLDVVGFDSSTPAALAEFAIS